MSLLFLFLYLSNLYGRLYGSTPANAGNIPAEPSSVSAPSGSLATDSANTSVNSGGIVRDWSTLDAYMSLQMAISAKKESQNLLPTCQQSPLLF